MPAPTIIQINDPVFTLADTEAGLAAGDAYQCQLTTAEIVAAPNLQTVPATGCAPASQIPAASSWSLHAVWLQDWTAPGGGLSYYAYEHETEPKWFSLKLDKDDTETVATGQVFIAAGSYGGVIGGPPVAADTTWPCLGKPLITVPADVAAAAAGAEQLDDGEQ